MPNRIIQWTTERIAYEADAVERQNAAVAEAIAEATRTGDTPQPIKVSPLRAGKAYRRSQAS